MRLVSGMRTRQKQHYALAPVLVRRSRFKLLLRAAIVTVTIAFIVLTLVLIHSYRAYAKLVDDRLARGYQSSRAGIYAAPRILRVGQKYSPERLADVLRRAGYIESDSASEVWSGSFSAIPQGVDIRPNNENVATVIHVGFDAEGRIGGLMGDGLAIESFAL